MKDTTSIEIGSNYVPWRDKIKLSVPEKCLEDPTSPTGQKWKYQNMHASVLRWEPKSEIDVIDQDLKKYYLSRKRGIDKPPSLIFGSRRETMFPQTNVSLKDELEKIKNITDTVKSNRNKSVEPSSKLAATMKSQSLHVTP